MKNKKIKAAPYKTLAAAATIMLCGFTAFAAVPKGTVIIGDKAYDLAYANDPANLAEIQAAIVASKNAIYIKEFDGTWVNNDPEVTPVKDVSVIPEVTYKDSKGAETKYAAKDGDVKPATTTPTGGTTTPTGSDTTTPSGSGSTTHHGHTDEDCVKYDKDTLVSRYKNVENITADLTLPKMGDYGSQITWKSDNTDVISDTGKVTVPVYPSKDATVHLTVSITKGSTTETYVFTVTVKSADNVSKINTDISNFNVLLKTYAASSGSNFDINTDNGTISYSGDKTSTISSVLLSAINKEMQTLTCTEAASLIKRFDAVNVNGKTLNQYVLDKLNTRQHTTVAAIFLNDVIKGTVNDADYQAFKTAIANKDDSYSDLASTLQEILPLTKDVYIPSITFDSFTLKNIVVTNNSTKKSSTITPGTSKSYDTFKTELGLKDEGSSVTLAALANSTVTVTFTGNQEHSYTYTFEDDNVTVESDKAALSLGDTSAVTGNLTLPTTGANGSTITWKSSDATIVSDSGAVTRPAYGTPDANITLTATITKNKVSDTKTFNVTIKAAVDSTAEATKKVDADLAALSLGDTSAVTTNLTLPATGANGSTITWKSNDTTLISDSGVVTRPDFYIGNKSTTLTATVTYGSVSKSTTINVTITKAAETDAEKTQEAADLTTLKSQISGFTFTDSAENAIYQKILVVMGKRISSLSTATPYDITKDVEDTQTLYTALTSDEKTDLKNVLVYNNNNIDLNLAKKYRTIFGF